MTEEHRPANRPSRVDASEEAAALREEIATLREEAVRARDEAARARAELEQLMAQLREANEHLVVGLDPCTDADRGRRAGQPS